MSSIVQDALPDYAELADTLKRCPIVPSPAEAHGFALGLSMSGADEPLQLWQKELYSELDPADVLAQECRSTLDRIFADVFRESGADLQFSLLLPTGITVDASRLSSVSDWCQGFLFGFGLGGETLTARLSEQTKELLRDLAEISRLDTEGVDNDEENQAALIEIEEYLRVGVMLIRDELNDGRSENENG